MTATAAPGDRRRRRASRPADPAQLRGDLHAARGRPRGSGRDLLRPGRGGGDASRPGASEHLHALVPTGRTKFRPCTARSAPAGRSCYVPATARGRAAAADAHVPGRRRRGRLPAHRLIVGGSGRRRDVHRPLHARRTCSARSRDASPRSTSATAPASGTRRSRTGAPASRTSGCSGRRVGRDAEIRTLAIGFGADPGPRGGRDGPGGAGRVQRDARDLLRRRRRSISTTARSRTTWRRTARATCCTRARSATAAAPSTAGGSTSGPTRRRPNAMQTSRNIVLSRAREGRRDPEPRDRGERRPVRPRGERRARSTTRPLFYLESRGIPRDEAERLIVTGFFQEVLDRVTHRRRCAGAPSRRSQEELGRTEGAAPDDRA